MGVAAFTATVLALNWRSVSRRAVFNALDGSGQGAGDVARLARQVESLRSALHNDIASLKQDIAFGHAAARAHHEDVQLSIDEGDKKGGMGDAGEEDAALTMTVNSKSRVARHFLFIESLHTVTLRDNPPRYLVLTPKNALTTRLSAAEHVDRFLSRHSVYFIETEPSNDQDPIMWVLELFPSPERDVFRALDELQHDRALSKGCAAVQQSRYWCSGWHADVWYSIRGSLNLALKRGEPMTMVFPDHCKDGTQFRKSWHYAADACPAKDLSCYFLNMSACPRQERFDKDRECFSLDRGYPNKHFEQLFSAFGELNHKVTRKLWDVHNDANGEFYNFLLYSYVTRPQYWLRQEVKRRVSKFKLKQPCAVMHVRQNDIAIHDNWRRFYYPIEAYLDVAKDALDSMHIHSILLMTDSSEVLQETKKHEQFEWRWMDKKRYSRNEGIKFENQFPSGSPKEETIALLTLFNLASQCRLFIGGVSGFGTLAYRYMCLMHTNNVWDCPPHRVVDQHKAYAGKHTNPDPRHNASSKFYGMRAVPDAQEGDEEGGV